MFQYHVSIFNNFDTLICFTGCPDGCHCFVFAPIVCHSVWGWYFPFFSISMVFYSCPVTIFGLCWKILFPSTNLCACHDTYSLYSQLCEGEWSVVNNQLFGHSWYLRKIYLWGRTWKDLLAIRLPLHLC